MNNKIRIFVLLSLVVLMIGCIDTKQKNDEDTDENQANEIDPIDGLRINYMKFSPDGNQALISSASASGSFLTLFRNDSFETIYFDFNQDLLNPYLGDIWWSKDSNRALIGGVSGNDFESKPDRYYLTYQNKKVTQTIIEDDMDMVYTGGWDKFDRFLLVGDIITSYDGQSLTEFERPGWSPIYGIEWNSNYGGGLLYGKYQYIQYYDSYKSEMKTFTFHGVGGFSGVEWLNNDEEAYVMRRNGEIYLYDRVNISEIHRVEPWMSNYKPEIKDSSYNPTDGFCYSVGIEQHIPFLVQNDTNGKFVKFNKTEMIYLNMSIDNPRNIVWNHDYQYAIITSEDLLSKYQNGSINTIYKEDNTYFSIESSPTEDISLISKSYSQYSLLYNDTMIAGNELIYILGINQDFNDVTEPFVESILEKIKKEQGSD